MADYEQEPQEHARAIREEAGQIAQQAGMPKTMKDDIRYTVDRFDTLRSKLDKEGANKKARQGVAAGLKHAIDKVFE